MKFLNKFKTKTNRICILFFTLLLTVLTIFLGTKFYTSKNYKTGGEYGGSGEVTVKVFKKNGGSYSTQEVQEIYENIKKHIDPLGIKNIANNSYISSGGLITFKKSGIKTQDELNKFAEYITNKPRLGIYSTGGQPLFENGLFPNKITTPSMPHSIKSAKWLDSRFQTPFEPGQAKSDIQNGKWVVRVRLKQSAIKEWQKLTAAIANFTPKTTSKNKKPEKGGTISMWINYQQLRREMFEKGMINERTNLFDAIHTKLPDGKPSGSFANNVFKLNGLDSPENYLISTAKISKSLNQQEFIISLGSNLSSNKARLLSNKLANQINYGSSTYKLSIKSSMFIPAKYGKSAFQKAILAGLIAFSVIAVFMIVNYGVLGVFSTIGMALYMFLTLTMFTIMRGEYSPETIASLIIGVGMAVDACIITFERLKNEVRTGSSIKKSNKIANKLSLSTIFDSNTTTIIVGFVLFYFGTSQIKGFSIMLILSIIFTLLIMLVFVRMISTLLINSGLINNKYWLIGVRKKTINSKPSVTKQKILNFNYYKSSKWFSIGSVIIVGASILLFSITAGIAGKMSSGFNSSIEFAGGTRFTIVNGANPQQNIKTNNAEKIKRELIKQKLVKDSEVKLIYQDQEKKWTRISIKSKNTINQSKVSNLIKKVIVDNNKFSVIGGSVDSVTAKALVKDAMIAIVIAFLAIVIYTLIRFKWTYSVAAIVALVHDGLIVTAIFIITRIEFSPIFVAGLLSVIGYSINDTIVTFDRIREKFKLSKKKKDKSTIISIANEAIRDTIKRSFLTTITTITSVIVLLIFGNATKLEFNIAMLTGLISGTYSSIFIATYIWVGLETLSQKRINSRSKNNFWKLKEKEEQVIIGINDYKD
ncbi:MAG: protein translocase subunit SecDF [Mycoplasma sp.]|nr:protein translocase subunit SecDF [Mycoplasma sp.]